MSKEKKAAGKSQFGDAVVVDMEQPNTIKTFGATIEIVEDGHARLRYRYRREWCNPRGTIQGGMFSVFLDEAMGYALIGRFPKMDTLWTTTGMTVNLLRAISGGDFIAEGRVVRAGRRTIYAEGEILTDDNKLAARASANFLIIKSPGLDTDS